MSHDSEGWQANYGGPDQGQQYRCILCGTGGASGRDHKPLVYHCHNKACNGQHTMWPTPQYQMFRAKVIALEVLIQHKTDYMEAAEETQRALLLENAKLRGLIKDVVDITKDLCASLVGSGGTDNLLLADKLNRNHPARWKAVQERQ